MTNREKVLAKYPKAWCLPSNSGKRYHATHHIIPTDIPPAMSIGGGYSEESAWADAAKRIEQEQSQ